jgi:hypothetical protein
MPRLDVFWHHQAETDDDGESRLRRDCRSASLYRDRLACVTRRMAGSKSVVSSALRTRSSAPAASAACLAAVLAGKGDFSALPRWEQTLQPLFFACFVARSVELKRINLQHLHVAGDGSKLPTWANPRGKKLCDCDNQGKKPQDRCRCHRAYRDPLALCGRDSYRQ